MKRKLKNAATLDTQAAQIYWLKITLRHTDPPIWRQVEVRGESKIDRLAGVVLTLFEWDSEHLAQFDIEGKIYSDESNWEEERPMWEVAHQVERFLQARTLPPKERAEAFAEAVRLQQAQRMLPRGVPALSALVTRARQKFTFTCAE